LNEEQAELADFIRFQRTSVGWSRERLAVEIGVSPATIKRYEKGKTYPEDARIVCDKVREAVRREHKARRCNK
jgi:ribosome-binding protein aMBF1 (putative translation factor)